MEDGVTAATNDRASEQLAAYNYCVSFIDVLGQRNALRGEGWLPRLKSEEEHSAFRTKLKETIGVILSLQQQAETMVNSVIEARPDSPFRKSLPPEHHATWDEMQKTRITTQRWSDGIVSFVCLGDTEIKCRMNGIFGLFGLAGSSCLLGLGMHRPVRGAIDGAWAVELRQGELYGAAVARAYELESEVASYPRIVVGQRVVELLQAHQAAAETDLFTENDRAMARVCLGMLVKDVDGSWIVDYLGEEFRRSITQSQHPVLYKEARQFVIQQLQEHQATKNGKLAFRYGHLLLYFNSHAPNSEQDAQPGDAGDAPNSAI